MAEKDLAFGNRLRNLLKSSGFSKKKLADSIEVSASAVGTYINEGRIPEAPILLKIARLLNLSMEELLTGEKSPRTAVPPGGGEAYPPEVQRLVNQLIDVLERGDPDIVTVIKGKIVEEALRIKGEEKERASKKRA